MTRRPHAGPSSASNPKVPGSTPGGRVYGFEFEECCWSESPKAAVRDMRTIYERARPTTVYTSRARWRRIAHELRGCPPTQRQLDDFARRLEGRMAPASINNHLRLLRAALNLMARYGYPVPAYTWPMLTVYNERDRICTRDEYVRLLLSCRQSMRRAIAIAWHTGMRAGEICRLHDRDMVGGIIRVRITKNKQPRVVPYTADLERDAGGLARGFVCGITARDLAPAFTRLVRKLGIVDLRFHDLRHTYATRLRRAGVDITTIMALLGHRDFKSARRYQTHTVDDLRDAVGSLSE